MLVSQFVLDNPIAGFGNGGSRIGRLRREYRALKLCDRMLGGRGEIEDPGE